VKGRYGWLLVIAVILAWDITAAVTNGESLTFTFRRLVAHASWRWPMLALVLLLVVHLFLPDRIAEKYDPLDRLYLRLGRTQGEPVHEPPDVPETTPPSAPPGAPPPPSVPTPP
jgi:hypothetical protein